MTLAFYSNYFYTVSKNNENLALTLRWDEYRNDIYRRELKYKIFCSIPNRKN